MIRIENTSVSGWEAAIRGMRNPMNSWDKSDSHFCDFCESEGDEPWEDCKNAESYCIGENDHDLMMRLAKAGTEHAKYRRMINVTADVTCHSVWWAEFDTYKVGTVRNSCSKMHKIHAKEFVADDFSHEGIDECGEISRSLFYALINHLEFLRYMFNSKKEKCYWRAIIELLPSGYNMKATVQLNYEVLANIYRQRKGHKLDEWHVFREWIRTLPYSEIITGGDYE